MDGDCVLEPFCREKGWFTTKLPPQPPPGNGKRDFESIWDLGVSCHMFHQVVVVWMLWVVWCTVKQSSIFPRCMLLVSQCVLHFHSTCLCMRMPTWWIIGTAGQLKFPKVYMSQPLQTQICTYKMVHLLKRWVLYRMAS